MAKEISDNILATFIDQKNTPLEELVFSEELKDEKYSDIIEFVEEIKDSHNLIDKLPKVEIPECVEFLHKLKELKELKDEFSDKRNNKIL